MKKYNLIIMVLVVCSFFACDDDNKEPKEAWNPGAIGEYAITPINGGATITYTIPNDPNILYIMAEYERNGKIFTEKSSVHKNSLTIEGFHRVDKVKAILYKVNREEQKSEPLTVEFEPLESLIDIAQKSLKLQPAFGGIIAAWDNPKTTEFGVRLMVKDTIGNSDQLLTSEMYYSAFKNEKHSFRGFDAKKTTFAVAFEDKWGNISDTTRFTTTPFFETMVPKPYADFRSTIPYDNTSNLSTTQFSIGFLWDNKVNSSGHGWLSKSGESGLSITIDLKQVAKLSRIVRHPYHVNSLYGQANITDFEAWGIDKIDYDKIADKSYWLDSLSVRWGAIHGVNPTTVLPSKTFKDDWQYLGRNTVPLGLTSTEQNEMSANGVESDVPVDAKPVRYVRIFVRGVTLITPPPSGNYFSSSEFTFYGDNTVPQN
ncbi:MAG TPA: hypothetical protein DEF88_14715 [Porphyromonadaceae bacterium]|jgi:hypothetical protein|nr:hypothetical protein [Porphyromonadaceae bacterium]HCM21211.1 hypothetical protein [Porphyromonadaceae bacterium]